MRRTKGRAPGKHGGGELELADERCKEGEADLRFRHRRRQQCAKLCEACWCTGQGLCDGVELDAEEGRAVVRALLSCLG